jgi:hypothetical protein
MINNFKKGNCHTNDKEYISKVEDEKEKPGGNICDDLKDYNLVIIFILPLLLLLLNDNWIFNHTPVDPLLYLGYILDYPQYVKTFGETYYVSRLAHILPGYFIHKIFPPLAANYIFHLLYFYLSVISLYLIIKYTINPRVALLVSILMAYYTSFLLSVGSDYPDGTAIAYCLLSILFITRSAVSSREKLMLFLGGIFFAAMIHSNFFTINLTPAFILYYCFTQKNITGSIFYGIDSFIIGAASITIMMGLINYLFGGAFLFFRPSVSFATTNLTYSYLWKEPLSEFAYYYWLVVPTAVFFFSFFRLMVDIGKNKKLIFDKFSSVSYLNYTVIAVIMIILNLNAPIFEFLYYANYLLPFLFLALASIISDYISRLSKSVHFLLVVLGILILLLSYYKPYVSLTTELFAGLSLPDATQFVEIIKKEYGLNLFLIFTLIFIILLIVSNHLRNILVYITILLLLTVTNICIGYSVQGSIYSLSRIYEYKNPRKDYYTAIIKAKKTMKEFDAKGNTYFWYNCNNKLDLGEIYNGLCSLYLYGYRLLGNEFPILGYDYRLVEDKIIPPLSTGQKIVILSEGSDVVEEADKALYNQNLKSKLIKKVNIKQGKYDFNMTFISTELSYENELVTSGVLFDLSEDALVNKMNRFIYGKTGKDQFLTKKKNEPTFLKPTDRRDHLATDFIDINRDIHCDNLFRLIVYLDDNIRPGKNCMLLIQDEKFNTIFGMASDVYEEEKDTQGMLMRYIQIPESVSSIRMNIFSSDGRMMYLPRAIRLEQVVRMKGTEGQRENDSPTYPENYLKDEKDFIRSKILFEISDENLFQELEGIIYGDKGRDQYLTKKENEPALLRPTDIRDHLATAFREIHTEKDLSYLRLRLYYHDGIKPGANCMLLVQDEDFNALLSIPCYDPGEKGYLGDIIKYITIPENVKKIRINIFTKDGNPTYLPNKLTLEQGRK